MYLTILSKRVFMSVSVWVCWKLRASPYHFQPEGSATDVLLRSKDSQMSQRGHPEDKFLSFKNIQTHKHMHTQNANASNNKQGVSAKHSSK